ncbi:hypothetical protein ACSU6B_07880 [Neobacillus sp. C211]|uniref:hypothetical protein n=1 Tax=unclassified Neobacillus TaxID=2675272 RepID=UPI00397BEF3A
MSIFLKQVFVGLPITIGNKDAKNPMVLLKRGRGILWLTDHIHNGPFKSAIKLSC